LNAVFLELVKSLFLSVAMASFLPMQNFLGANAILFGCAGMRKGASFYW
jgi:hypothetical protein